MKRLSIFLFSFLLSFAAFAGGIVTNTNQSASWVRTMVRDASVGVDAVLYNPAGLTRLDDGFHIQFNHQTVVQPREINAGYAALNEQTYEGVAQAPFFPSFYAAYKKGKFVVWAGFAVVGGGGSAEFDKGLPDFERGIADLKGVLGATNYSADIYLKGTSAYFGLQAGVSYKINDMISVGVGGRYLMARNTYEGHIKSIMANAAGGDMVKVQDYATDAAAKLAGAANSTGALKTAVGGNGALTIAQLKLNPATAASATALGAGVPASVLAQYGVTSADALTLDEVQAGYTSASAGMTDLAAATGDKELDVKQDGNSFTPIISVDISLLDGDLGIALKYEHKTPLEIKNDVTKDDFGMFVVDEELPAEMPSFLSVGVRYKVSEKLRIQAGFHYYMDLSAKYGNRDDAGEFVTNDGEKTFEGEKMAYLTANSYELALGAEYSLSDMLTLSAGYLYATQSANAVYQSSMSPRLNSSTIGFGGAAKITDRFCLELGFSYSMYNEGDKTFTYSNTPAGVTGTSITESYKKTAYIGSLGLTYRFGGVAKTKTETETETE